HFRGHEEAVDHAPRDDYRLSVAGDRYEVTRPDMLPTLRFVMSGEGAAFTYDGGSRREISYPKEYDRGYQSSGPLWSPGFFRVKLERRRGATLIASTEWWSTMLAIPAEEALKYYHDRRRRMLDSADPKTCGSPAQDLVLGTDQFIITPAGRIQD